MPTNRLTIVTGITPKTIYKSVEDVMSSTRVADEKEDKWGARLKKHRRYDQHISAMEQSELIEKLEQEMKEAAKKLEFERAAVLRDEIDWVKDN